jgi:hypothetical protein
MLIHTMTKRTIKAAAGDSRVSAKDARSAARYVYRDGTTITIAVSWRDLPSRSKIAVRRAFKKY